MSTQLIEPLVTVEALESMPDDGNIYEVIEGEIFVSRAPALPHQIIATNVTYVYKRYLVTNPLGVIVQIPGLIFDDYDGVIPDLVFISHERRKRLQKSAKIHGAPEIVIEIISPGKRNEDRDRISKLQLYSRHGVGEYWVIDPFRRSIEIYRRRDLSLKLFATAMDADEITTPILPGFTCTAEEILIDAED